LNPSRSSTGHAEPRSLAPRRRQLARQLVVPAPAIRAAGQGIADRERVELALEPPPVGDVLYLDDQVQRLAGSVADDRGIHLHPHRCSERVQVAQLGTVVVVLPGHQGTHLLVLGALVRRVDELLHPHSLELAPGSADDA
jgi:hypothetical protein